MDTLDELYEKAIKGELKPVGPLPKYVYDPDDLCLDTIGKKSSGWEPNGWAFHIEDEESVNKFFEILSEKPKTATELSNNSFNSNKDYTRDQIIDIIDKEFNKLVESFEELEELNLTGDERYLIEKAKSNIIIRLCGINFAEKVYVPIYKPVSPYEPFYPYVTNPTIDWTYTTDKTTIRPRKEM